MPQTPLPKPRTLTRQQIREIDRRAVDEYGMASLVLMENAGRGCVDTLCRLGVQGPVLILCGKGNNAGDGLVMARHLDLRGMQVQVALLAAGKDLRGDAAANYAILAHTDVPLVEIKLDERLSVEAQLDDVVDEPAWIVDALLGTGATGAPRPPFDSAIRWMNGRQARKLAVDLPSGLDCDTGEAAGEVVCANETCSFVAAKPGFFVAHGPRCTGRVHVLDIGAPRKLVEAVRG